MKKGQLQMMETIFVVMIVILIIVFVMSFYSKVEEGNIQEKYAKYSELSAIETSEIASGLSEVQCSMLEVVDLSCFDIEKMDAFVKIDELYPQLTREYYFTKLGNSKVFLEEVYPSNRNWTIYDNNLREGLSQRGLSVFLPVSLYNATSREYTFGIITITKYVQKIG